MNKERNKMTNDLIARAKEYLDFTGTDIDRKNKIALENMMSYCERYCSEERATLSASLSLGKTARNLIEELVKAVEAKTRELEKIRRHNANSKTFEEHSKNLEKSIKENIDVYKRLADR
jgi:hypothetical protein